MAANKSKQRDYFSLNGIEIPVIIENGEYYLNGQKREAHKID